MPERRVAVASTVGLHARPATTFAQAAAAAPVPVRIAKDGQAPVDASSVLLVLTLGVEHGDEVVLSAEGDGADAALDELVDLLSTELGYQQGSLLGGQSPL